MPGGRGELFKRTFLRERKREREHRDRDRERRGGPRRDIKTIYIQNHKVC